MELLDLFSLRGGLSGSEAKAGAERRHGFAGRTRGRWLGCHIGKDGAMMGFDDYVEQVRSDAQEAMAEGASWCDSWEEMADALFLDDAVTGNASGSYTFNGARALENVRGLLGDEVFAAEAEAAGYGPELFARDPETLDVIARCLALGTLLGELEGAYRRIRESSTDSR